jgi:hypothetical protein
MVVTEHKLQIYLPRALYRHLKEAARARGVGLSAYVRELLSEDARNGRSGPADPLLALVRSAAPYGPKDGSRHVDRYLYGS